MGTFTVEDNSEGWDLLKPREWVSEVNSAGLEGGPHTATPEGPSLIPRFRAL